MTIELAENRYGKSRVRLMKVTRPPRGHEVREWTVEVLLQGNFTTAHTEGENSLILATDTMKNTVYSLARSSSATTMEAFATELACFLLSRNPQVASAAIRIESALWKRLTVEGQPHPSAFMHGSGERQTTRVELAQGGTPSIHSGLDNLVILKTANSAFAGYIQDSLTTLKETHDRLFCTALRAEWSYTSTGIDFDATRAQIRETMLKTFAQHDSKSVQQTLYAMAESALLAVPTIDSIELAMPNRHCLLVDLARFGQDNPNEIFVPTDEPHGYIEGDRPPERGVTLQERAAEVIARCRRLALCTETKEETTRLFLCPAMQEAHALLRGWMETAGTTVRVDSIGNLRGLYPGQCADAPRLLIGSHLDTVPNAGAFDGVLGVLLGLALVEELCGDPLSFAIELIGFSEEEGVRFGKPFLGSLSLLGELPPEALALRDRRGITIADAVRSFGLNPANLSDALLAPRAFAYLELHIEQGPVLESLDRPLGVVSAIAGQTRLELHFTGQANHAGTTPMALRHDALAAAAVWMVAVEAYARDCHDLVATIGRIVAEPGAVNVVPGSVRATLDVRHADDTIRQAALLALQTAAHAAAHARGVTVAGNLLHEQPAVPLDPRLTAILQQAAALAGHDALPMPSGAGHDAMILAPRLPSAMLFLRSPGGLSHHPQEAVLPEDVTAALATGLHFLRLLRP